VGGVTAGMYLLQQTSDNRSSANVSSWAFPSFGCRVPVTLSNDSNKATGPYPAKVQLNYSFFNTLPANCKPKANYQDVRFTSLEGRELPYAVANNNQQQKFISFHVRLPQLPVGKTTLWMYVGDATAQSAENPRATYDYYQDFNTFRPTVKFGVFTDLHHDGTENHFWIAPDGRPAALRNGLPRLNHIISQMNAWNAEFLVSLGDLITAENFTPPNPPRKNDLQPTPQPIPPYPNPPTQMTGELSAAESILAGKDLVQKSRKDLTDVEAELRKFTGERYYVQSNHEYYFLSDAEIISGANPILGGQGARGMSRRATSAQQKSSHFFFDKGGVRFIGLDLQYDHTQPDRHRGPEGGSNYGEGFMPQWQLDWLDATLRGSSNPAVILSPSHLENADYLEDELPAEQNACETRWNDNYCTASNCASNPSVCISLCKDLGEYRRVRNAAAIRAVLEKHVDKVLMVLQGNDHARAHYIQNGINYLTLDGAESIVDTDVSYYQFEIDPKQKLVSLRSFGKDNTYSMTYADGKMQLSSSLSKEFFVAPLSYGKTWSDAAMVQANWSASPTGPAQQLGVGFLTDADRVTINHRCAPDGRPRKHNLAGIRRVFANRGENNYIGTEVVKNGVSNTSLDYATRQTSGTFWAQLFNNQVQTWHSDGNRGGALPAMAAPQQRMSPGVWLYDSTSASIDSLIVRTAVSPEPTGTPSSAVEVNPLRKASPAQKNTKTAPSAVIKMQK
jgi:hypothetical protein